MQAKRLRQPAAGFPLLFDPDIAFEARLIGEAVVGGEEVGFSDLSCKAALAGLPRYGKDLDKPAWLFQTRLNLLKYGAMDILDLTIYSMY